MNKPTEKPKLSPEEYKKILQGIKLMGISLKESKAFINTDLKAPTELNIKIKDEASFKVKEENEVHVFQLYSLDARKPSSKSRYIQIEVNFIIKLSSKEIFTEDFFEIYKNISLHLNTWPYFREYVNQATARMNIQALTIPLYTTP